MKDAVGLICVMIILRAFGFGSAENLWIAIPAFLLLGVFIELCMPKNT